MLYSYLIAGLSLFFYLIATQIQEADPSILPFGKIRPAIYYSLFIKIIIVLNALSGVCRLIGAIFVLIFNKILKKIKKRNFLD
jgi:hypothetical protein